MNLIAAVNQLSSQAWAGVLIIMGLIALPLCWHYHQPDTIAAGIVAAGIGMFTSDARKSTQTNTTPTGSSITTSETPSIPKS